METIAIDRRLDPDFKLEIASRPGGENIRKGCACGTCTAGCPGYHVEHAYNPRKIIRMILLGMREQVLSSKTIWLCSQCYTCSANCPQDVDFSDIMSALRDMAVKEGYASADLRERVEAVSTAAHEFRRDCIHLLLGVEDRQLSVEGIRANVDKALAQIVRKG